MRIVLAVVGNRGHDPSAGERAGVFVHHAMRYAAELRFKGVGLRVNASSSLQLQAKVFVYYQQRPVERLSHMLIPDVAWMQMIARVPLRQHAVQVRGILQQFVEATESGRS